MADILPHEKSLLMAKMAEGVRANHEVAGDMTNAIENGNQWHDNAEYDEAIERMKLIDSIYGRIASALSEAVVVDYPEADAETVAIGSLVKVVMHGDAFHVAVVGQNLVGKDAYEAAWTSDDDFEVTAATAPMGAALLGRSVGQDAAYRVGDKILGMSVAAIDQAWMRESFADMVAPTADAPVS